MKLSAFQYKIQHISSKDNACADFLLRSPIPRTREEQEDKVLLIDDDSVPVTARVIASETARDPILARVKQLTLFGWPQYLKEEDLQPYFQRQTELSVDQDFCFMGNACCNSCVFASHTFTGSSQ